MTRHANRSDRRCDGVLRRDVLRVGGLTALGLGLTDWFRLAAAGAATGSKPPACILIWLDGGPSHLETFDLKPEAAEEVRGPFQPIKTAADGVRISEYMPRTAKVMDRVALIRSMTSTLGEHNFASHYMLTGYKPTPALQYPGYGAVVGHLRRGDRSLPANISLSPHDAMAGPGYLPASAEPFVIEGDPSKPEFRVQDLDPYAGVSAKRLARRRSYQQALDRFSRDVEEGESTPSDPAFDRAYRLINSKRAKAAFDLSKEPTALRKRYGMHKLGQSCLLARRLVEAGAPFITVTDRGWDTHEKLFNRLKEGYTGGTAGKIPKLDTAYAALLGDLRERRLLDDTLVLLMGEFGRTPKLNTRGGRDHWPRCFSVALAGGGVPGGQVIGASDPRGEIPDERPVSPADLARTIYTRLGIDPDHEFHTPDGRPVLVNRDGKPIHELLA